MSAPVRASLLALLHCPACGAPFCPPASLTAPSLECRSCHAHVPVRDGVPRFVSTPDDPVARRTQASFGYEWSVFNDWSLSGEVNFQDYFGGLDLESLRDGVVLDAGCGMGRHARQVAPYAGRLVAADFSAAIEQAARNTATQPNVLCIQADILHLPLADGSIDFAYSMGVLHHLADTRAALASLARKVRPGGRVRIYLYWKLHGWRGLLLKVATALRVVTTRLPFHALRLFCWLLSLALWAGVVMPYRALSRLGVRTHESFPLFVYTKYPFRILYNDQFDRLSAPIERRFDADEVKALLESVGLTDVTVVARFGWIADGVKPASGIIGSASGPARTSARPAAATAAADRPESERRSARVGS
jgi:SAM-dependent methyltransferase